MPRYLKRTLTIALLVLWTAPGLGMAAFGLHLAESHGGDRHCHHSDVPIEDLAKTTAHGHHHHDAELPDHDHPMVLDAIGDPDLSLAASAVAPEVTVVPLSWGRVEPAGPWSRRGPPAPIFYTCCSLLL